MTYLFGSGKRSSSVLGVLALVLVGSVFAQAPAIVEQPRPLSVGPGDRAGFVVSASGASPLSYQWYRGGALIAGATADYVLLPSAQSSDAGDYTVRISNAEGAVTSAPAKLTIAAYTKDWYDPTYQGAGSPVLILSDGGTLSRDTTGASSVVRTKPNGELDASFKFTPPDGGLPITWMAFAAAQRDDGRYYVIFRRNLGPFGEPQSITFSLKRLNRDGSIDPTFTSSVDGDHQVPDLLKVELARHILLPVAEKLLVAHHGTLVRLNQDGSIDSTFKLILPTTAPVNFVVTAAALDRAGNILVGGNGCFWRARSDGSLDPTFSVSANLGTATDIVSTSEGGCWLGTIKPDEYFFEQSFGYRVSRFTATGQLDAAVKDFSMSTWGPPDMSLEADGRVVIAGFFEIRRVVGEAGREEIHRGVLRLLADGSIDPTLFSVFPWRTSWTKWWMLPDGTHANSGGWKMNLSTVGSIEPPRILRIELSAETILAGDDLTIRCIAVGPSPLTMQANSVWANRGEDQIVLRNIQTEDVLVTVVGLAGEARKPVKVKVSPSAPRITEPLAPVIARQGQDVRFNATVRGSGPITYQWFKDGVPLNGVGFDYGDGRIGYSLSNAGNASVGTYTLRATNAWGTAECSATLAVTQKSQLTNLSVRARAGSGDDVMIVGLVLQHPKKILFQAIGPELANFGVGNLLGDPTATLHMTSGAELPFDDGGSDLGKDDPFYQATGAWVLDGATTKSSEFRLDSLDGANTVVVSGKNGATGVVLAQVFDADGSTNRMVNLSARVFAGTGDATAITGLTVKGDAPHRVLIRCVGPGLSGTSLANLLLDPTLTLVNQQTHEAIAANDNWSAGAASEVNELRSTMQAVGAFPLVEGSKDAAMLVTLPPGAYTALVSGVNGTTGIVLLEVYDVQ